MKFKYFFLQISIEKAVFIWELKEGYEIRVNKRKYGSCLKASNIKSPFFVGIFAFCKSCKLIDEESL